jgi:hypothetical protein
VRAPGWATGSVRPQFSAGGGERVWRPAGTGGDTAGTGLRGGGLAPVDAQLLCAAVAHSEWSCGGSMRVTWPPPWRYRPLTTGDTSVLWMLTAGQRAEWAFEFL